MGQREGYPANGLMDYAEAIAKFSLEGLAAKLHGSLETGLNACIECCDRHAAPGREFTHSAMPRGLCPVIVCGSLTATAPC